MLFKVGDLVKEKADREPHGFYKIYKIVYVEGTKETPRYWCHVHSCGLTSHYVPRYFFESLIEPAKLDSWDTAFTAAVETPACTCPIHDLAANGCPKLRGEKVCSGTLAGADPAAFGFEDVSEWAAQVLGQGMQAPVEDAYTITARDLWGRK